MPLERSKRKVSKKTSKRHVKKTSKKHIKKMHGGNYFKYFVTVNGQEFPARDYQIDFIEKSIAFHEKSKSLVYVYSVGTIVLVATFFTSGFIPTFKTYRGNTQFLFYNASSEEMTAERRLMFGSEQQAPQP